MELSWEPLPGTEAVVVVPSKGTEAVVEPETVSDPEVEVGSEPGECGTGTDPRVLVGVGMAPVLVPPRPGIRPVDLGGKRLPFGTDAVGIKAVLPVAVEVTPSRESTPDTRVLTKSPEVVVPEVGVVNGELVAEAGTLTGIVGELKASEDTVTLVPLPVEDLSPSPKRSARSEPELVMLEAALLILFALEVPVGAAETELLVVDSPRTPANPEVKSPRRPSLEDAVGVEEAGEVTLADESEVAVSAEDAVPVEDAVAVEGVVAVEDVESPPRRLPKPEFTLPSRPALEVAEDAAAVEGVVAVEDVESPPRRLPKPEFKSPSRPALEVVVEALADESITDPCLLVVSASVDAASELFLVVFSVDAAWELFWVVLSVDGAWELLWGAFSVLEPSVF